MNNSLHIDPVLLREAERQARLKNVNLSEVVEAFIRKFVNHPEEEKKNNKSNSIYRTTRGGTRFAC